MFVEVFLYTKVTGLILNQKASLETPKAGNDAEEPIFHYSLDYCIRYNNREMTWVEHLNHAKPLHKAQSFRIEYALGLPLQQVSYYFFNSFAIVC